MNDIISYRQVEQKVIEIRGEKVILDSDVAELYGVETMRINEAVKNNPNKFPEGYVLSLDKNEWGSLKSKFSISKRGGKNKLPKAFTEKGLYMLATILKSPVATQTTIAIVETFTKLRELSAVINQMPAVQDKERQNGLLRRGGEILGDLLDSSALEVSGDETTFELNLALVNIKRTVKREKRKESGEDTVSF